MNTTESSHERGITAGEAPFSREHYKLASCTLHGLKPEEVPDLSSHLVSLDPWRTLGYTPAGLAAYLNRVDPALSRFRIEVAQETAGLVCVRYPWLLGPYLELIALFAPRRGRGAGREILAWIEEQARPRSRNIWTLASSFNLPARGFYRHMGFVEAGTLTDLVKPGHDEILLRKTL